MNLLFESMRRLLVAAMTVSSLLAMSATPAQAEQKNTRTWSLTGFGANASGTIRFEGNPIIGGTKYVTGNLTSGSGCVSIWQGTRLIAPGSSFGSGTKVATACDGARSPVAFDVGVSTIGMPSETAIRLCRGTSASECKSWQKV